MESKAPVHAHAVHASKQAVPQELVLPTSVVTTADVGKILRELEKIENNLLQLKMRDSGSSVAMPTLTKRIEELLAMNKLNLLHQTDIKKLRTFLEHVKEKAPVMHISFSSEPTPAFLEKLIVWIRRELKPDILLTIGLQPAIGAGCMLRTTNKFFDLSLRQTFVDKRTLLLEQIIPPAPGVPQQ